MFNSIGKFEMSLLTLALQARGIYSSETRATSEGHITYNMPHYGVPNAGFFLLALDVEQLLPEY